jgi:Sec-independent protein translocase protein TatA
MEILGIGPMELFFIVILALIILGPKDMMKAGRTIGKFLRDVTRSEYYQAFVSSSKEIKNLPTRLIREANLEEELKEVDRALRPAGSLASNTIQPPQESAGPDGPPADATPPAGPSQDGSEV